jgi:SH3-like domain-containing protein
MRSCPPHSATLLLVVAIVMATSASGLVYAAVDQTPPPGDNRTPHKAAGEAPRHPAPTKHRPDAHTHAGPVRGSKPVEPPKVAPPVAVAPPAQVAPVAPPANPSGEPPPKLPRFAALKTDETNMRKGPGQRYPIEWVYNRRDLPMQVEREYDVWRYVRDPDGVEGWVHQVTLSDRRTFMVQGKDAIIRADPNDTSTAVAALKVGVIGRLRTCDGGSKWCQVQVGGYKGYLRRDQFWGLLPDEVVGPS